MRRTKTLLVRFWDAFDDSSDRYQVLGLRTDTLGEQVQGDWTGSHERY